MSMHLGTTAGLLVGTILMVVDALKRRKDGQSREEILGGIGESFIGVNYGAPEGSREFRPETMRFTLPVVGGAAATWVAKKTHYNDDTPKGVNV
ncbi:MAG: hypothetical protein KAY32_18220 [Candidatus Eisenbacteria sp.]|nr:hypothetical protein [Candidatus Eisenbacteria bacterium]